MNTIDSQWEKVQEQIFLEWINETLPEIQLRNIQEQLDDGIIIIKLVEKLKERKCQERINDHPKMRIQKISNCTIALRFIQQCYQLKSLCSAENIVDCQKDPKYLLGLLFQLYLQHHKTLLISSQHNQQQQYNMLLQWLRQTIGDYDIQLDTQQNMMKNFYNGKILIALLDCFFEQNHQFFEYMMQKGEGERIGISMRMAHDLLGVTELLTTEDVIAHHVDSRVFFIYFDFMMNAFKTKARIMNIDLIHLVEEGIKQMNEKMKNELPEETERQQNHHETKEQDINLINHPQRSKSFRNDDINKTIERKSSFSSDDSSSSDDYDFDSSDNQNSFSSDEENEMKQIPHQNQNKKPVVLKDVLYKGRVDPMKSQQRQQHQNYYHNNYQNQINEEYDIFEEPEDDRKYKQYQQQKTMKQQQIQRKPMTSELSLYDSYGYKQNQSTTIQRKHHHHHKHHFPHSYTETTTETTITTSSNIPNNFNSNQYYSKSSEKRSSSSTTSTVSYSFYFI